MGSKKVLFFFLLAIFFHISLFFVKNYVVKQNDALEQENFIVYVSSLKSGLFPKGLTYEDTRFFPGLPILIYSVDLIVNNPVFSGIMLILVFLSIIFFITYSLTKNPPFSFWITIFPPIVFEQTSKISTEIVIVALFFAIYMLFKKEKFLFASFLASLAIIVRPISICIYSGLLIFLLKEKKFRIFVESSTILVLFIADFIFSNLLIWKDPFYQFKVTGEMARVVFVIPQILKDIPRAFELGEFRILISGLIYILFSVYLLFLILKKKNDFLVKNDNIFIKAWSVFTFIFIYSIGPTPFLEEARRYLVAFFPLALLVNYKNIVKRKIIYYLSFILSLFAFI